MEHIAIMKKYYFDLIKNGTKTIESRFSFHKIAPFNKVNIDDTIYFKITGQKITLVARVKDVKYFNLTPSIVKDICVKYGKQIGTDNFKDYHMSMDKNYCTLIWLKDVKEIEPIEAPKSYGSGWIVLDK